MLNDLQWHELEVVKAFFARGIAWAQTESASESARLAALEQPDNDTVEGVVTGPHSAHELEQIVHRAVIHELNSLCEFALQNTWLGLSGPQLSEVSPQNTVTKLGGLKLFLPNGDLVLAASRGDIEKALRDEKILGNKATDVEKWPGWLEVQKIKELSEGFKHRQRFQPFPAKFHSARNQWRGKRLINADDGNSLAEYELTSKEVAGYIDSVDKLFSWLGSNRMLWMA